MNHCKRDFKTFKLPVFFGKQVYLKVNLHPFPGEKSNSDKTPAQYCR